MEKNSSIDFELAMKELETVVSELDGEVKLEQALDLFERGMKLSKQCEEFLKGAEQKIEMLKRADDGAPVAVPVGADGLESAVAEKSAQPAKRRKSAVVDGDTPVVVEAEFTNQLTLNTLV